MKACFILRTDIVSDAGALVSEIGFEGTCGRCCGDGAGGLGVRVAAE